ncbi:GNAT family N-acetyltransferase [Thalassovita mediterranea]|nr:GNAT family N-acetyltransferase [Thalassovita mediterranea]
MGTHADYIDFSDLTGADREAWATLQASDPCLWSPYFSYSYIAAAEAARPGVKIIRFSHAGKPVAYWPIRPGPLGTARPVGGPMDDLHGIVAAPDTVLDLSQRAVSRHIGGYAFTATPNNQQRHGLIGHVGDGNHIMDLSDGYEAWLEERQAASTTLRREYRKAEKLLSDADTQVEHDLVDAEAFDRLLELKQIAYRQSGHFPLFSLEWPRRLLETLQETNAPDARGVLSTLRIKGELVAVCFNMRSERVLHYWFPAYEEQHSKLRPGLVLLFSLAEWSAEQGIQEIHLGLGDVEFKHRMGSWMSPVKGGSLAIRAPQKIATSLTGVTTRIEGQNALLDLPAKLARKYHRVMLAGALRA